MMDTKNIEFASARRVSRASALPRLGTLLLLAALVGLPACTKKEEVGTNETLNEVHDVAADAKAKIRDEATDAKNKIHEETRDAKEEIKDAAADQG